MKQLSKISIMILALWLMAVNVNGQNLVPNPSFEDTVSCPDGFAQIDRASNWSSGGGSPEYFNACAPSGGVSVPNNFYGYENASSGNAYIGLYTFNKGTVWPNHRENIQADLNTPLTIGVRYYVSMDISFTLDAFDIETGYASDKLGMLFTNVNSYDANNPPITNNNAQVYIDTIISDTSGWYHFEGSFIADSAYQKVLIGNFFDDTNTDTMSFDTSLFIAYYYVDNVCVSSDSNDCLLSTNINSYKFDNDFKIFPNPTNKGFIWLVSNDINSSIGSSYQVYNNVGQKVLENKISENQHKIKLDELGKGIYYVKISTGSKQSSLKFIIN